MAAFSYFAATAVRQRDPRAEPRAGRLQAGTCHVMSDTTGHNKTKRARRTSSSKSRHHMASRTKRVSHVSLEHRGGSTPGGHERRDILGCEDIDPIRWVGPWLDRNQLAVEDWLLLLFTATLAVQRPHEDQQRYRRDAAEPYGERDRPKPEEYPCDEGGEDHCDGCHPRV
jgi:hypothetical protein